MRTVQDKISPMSMNMPINEEGDEFQDVLLSEVGSAMDGGADFDSLMEEVFNNELSRKEKEVVFFYLQGWTTREIAERLGISHVSVVAIEGKIREKCKKLKNSV